MNAAEARKYTENKIKEMISSKELEMIYDAIKESTSYGISWLHYLNEETRKMLEFDGYKVKYINGDFRDPRDTGYWQINW